MKPRMVNPRNRNLIYPYKYFKTFITKTIITVVAILLLLIIKKTNFKTSNKVIDVIRSGVKYEFHIVQDSKKAFSKVQGWIGKSLDSITVFNKMDSEKIISPISGSIFRNFIIDLDREDIRENNGIDIKSNGDDNPKAVVDGKVTSVEIRGSKGYFITIEEDNMKFVYGYLSKPYVSKGSLVNQGDYIGTLGTNKDGEKYLRFEIYIDGEAVNPLDYIDFQ